MKIASIVCCSGQRSQRAAVFPQRAHAARVEYMLLVRSDCIAPGTALRVAVTEHCAVAIFNVAGRIYATEDMCVRCGSSLASGTLDGAVVSCGGCDWRYDVTTGRVNDIPALRIDTFETKIIDSRIWIATTASP